jgi:hypothetical protein
MRSLSLLVVLFLTSVNVYGGELCFRDICTRSSDSNFGCVPKSNNVSLFELNGIRLDTTFYYLTDDAVTVQSKACPKEGEYLYEGENTMRYAAYWNGGGLNKGWLRTRVYIAVDGRQVKTICSVYLTPSSNTQSVRCGTTFSIDLEDLDPDLEQKFNNAKNEAKKMLEEAEKFYDEINIEITILNEVFDSIVNIDFDNISSEDLARVEQALALYNNLKSTLDALRVQIETETENFIEYMDELESVVEEVLEDEGIDPDDYEVDHPLEIPEITIPDVVDDYTYYSENNFYTDYADSVLAELEKAVSYDNRPLILRIVEAWLITNERLKNNLQSQTYQSPAEWDAFLSSFARVDRFIFGDDNTNPILDRDLWFSDSPVTLDEREAIENIKEYYHGEGTIIENEVKTWREEDLTDERKRMLESFEALAPVAEAAENSSQEEAETVASIITGAAIVIKEALPCIAVATAAGDFGDFFEVTTGISICTGKKLTTSERVYSALGLVVGSGALWRALNNASGAAAGARHVANLSASIIEKANKVGITTKKELQEMTDLVNSRYICSVKL